MRPGPVASGARGRPGAKSHQKGRGRVGSGRARGTWAAESGQDDPSNATRSANGTQKVSWAGRSPVAGYRSPGAGRRVPVAGCRSPGAGRRVPVPVAGCRSQPGRRVPVAG